MNDARQASGCASKTDTIVFALKEVVRRHRVGALKAMLGTLPMQVDLAKTRGRRAASSS